MSSGTYDCLLIVLSTIQRHKIHTTSYNDEAPKVEFGS